LSVAPRVGVARPRAQHDRIRVLAIAERIDVDAESTALADELEHRPVQPVHDRALGLAWTAVRGVLADLADEQILRDENSLVVKKRKRLREEARSAAEQSPSERRAS
jgi:hypothetical protein